MSDHSKLYERPKQAPAHFVYNPPTDPLSVVYQDDALLVISKPSGLLSVSGRKEEHKDSLQTRVLAEYPQARIVHRLDMDTSGLIIMALTADAHRHLGLQFERRKTRKVYQARVWGQVAQDKGDIDLPIICDWPNRPLQMIDHANGRPAQTAYEVVSRTADETRVMLYPHTGRTHQLRLHMAEIGHPILGDDFYAHPLGFRAADRLCLHAQVLEIHHPDHGERITFEDPCPF